MANDDTHGRLNETPHRSDARFEHRSDISVKENPKEHHENQDECLFQNSRQPQPLLFYWWLEAVACCLSVAALLALGATLYAYRDKPSPAWPEWISVNTIVAIYIVVLKTSVLLVAAEGIGQLKWSWFETERPLSDLVKYDDASRGPYGAAVLLWRLRASHVLASYGALITVLALATDPFAQQIIRYYDCPWPAHTATPTLPRTNYFSGRQYESTDNIGLNAQRAMNEGLFNPNPFPPFECSTGNCTWPSSYSSVGFCSHCKDISGKLSFTEKHYRNPDNLTVAKLTTSLLGYDGLSVTMDCSDQQQVAYAAMGGAPGECERNSFTCFDFILAKSCQGAINPITGVSFPGCRKKHKDGSWRCRGYGASRCSIFPCVRTYDASVRSGRLAEHVLDTTSNWIFIDQPTTYFATLDTKCINSHERSSLEELGYQLKGDERWMEYNLQFDLGEKSRLENTFPQSMALRGCLYAMDIDFTQMLWYYMQDLFAGTDVTGTITGTASSAVYDWSSFGDIQGPDGMKALYNYGDVTFERIDDSFRNMSISLTNYVRQNGQASYSKPAEGIATVDKTCIGVRWPWLAFPASLVILALIFVALLTWETSPRRTQRDIWKSSPLALLYHGLAQSNEASGDSKATGHLNYIVEMRARAKVTRVKLDDSNHSLARLEVQAHKQQ